MNDVYKIKTKNGKPPMTYIFYKRVTVLFSTKKEEDINGNEFVNCLVCGDRFTEGIKLVEHAMKNHKGKQGIQ